MADKRKHRVFPNRLDALAPTTRTEGRQAMTASKWLKTAKN
jgi:hypothetical protein